MKFNSLIPELTVSDLEKSKTFYLSIGFHIVYEREETKFCFLQLEENQIMIEEDNDHWDVAPLEHPYGRGINISMAVSNIEEYYSKVLETGFPIFLELETHPYRVDDQVYEDKEFLIQDPDGYLLRFNN
ncbi:MAG: VOC family protein [Bacilli bacterium]|nr:VOC family protein [Bacilli bacterium]